MLITTWRVARGISPPRAPRTYVTWSRASASYLSVLFRCPLPKPDMSLSVSSGFPVPYPLTPSRTVPVDVLVAPGTDDQGFAMAGSHSLDPQRLVIATRSIQICKTADVVDLERP